METEQAKFEGWAIVEMMGHQREIGYVTTEAYGVAVLFRIDVPEIPAYEFILKRPEYGSDGLGGERYLPVGTKVQREGTQGRSRLVSPAALYAMNPCTQDAAVAALKAASSRPLICIELPKERLLAIPGENVAAEEEGVCTECGASPGEWHEESCSKFKDDLQQADGEDSVEHADEVPEKDDAGA